MKFFALTLVALVVQLTVLPSLAQDRPRSLKVLVDSEVDEKATSFPIVVVSTDANIVSVLISNPDLPTSKWKTFAISTTSTVSTDLDRVAKAGSRYSIIGFGSNGVPVEIRELSGNSPLDNRRTESEAEKLPPSSEFDAQSKSKAIVVKKQKPVVESSHILEIRPANNVGKLGARHFRVSNSLTRRKPKEFPIRFESDGKTPVPTQSLSVELFEGVNKLTIELIDGNKTPLGPEHTATVSLECGTPCESFGRSINTRAIVGVEQAGASSANPKSSPFVNFFINVPLGSRGNPRQTPPRFSVWTDFRIASTSSQELANLRSITDNILRPNASTPINNVVQSFRINAGIDLRIVPETALFPSFMPAKSSLSLIAGAGATSPLTGGRTGATETYRIPKINGQIIPEFSTLFPEIPNDKDNVAFVTPERDRFLRRWFVGTRILTHFYKGDSSRMDLSPASLDITIGQDEAITRKLSSPILNFEGFLPFPTDRFNYVYFYAGLSTRFTRKVNTRVPTFFLESATLSDLSDPLKTYVVSADENPLIVSNRDSYFFGIGIDLIKLFREKPVEP
jgi:hypothetical protein